MNHLSLQLERYWHVIYTMPKAEKKIFSAFQQKGIEAFLPLYKDIRQWSDRKKKIEVPLFPNYIFVKVPPKERYQVLKVNGVIRYLTDEGKPSVVPEDTINSIRIMLYGAPVVSSNDYKKGEKLRVTGGPMTGLCGVLVERKGKYRLAVSIDIMQRSVLIEVPTQNLERCN